MFDNNKIEEAAKYYAEENSMSIEDQMGDTYDGIEELSDAYKAGAKWTISEFLKDLWHPAQEVPEDNRYILLELKYCSIKSVIFYNAIKYNSCYDEPWNSKIKSLNITQWLYIDDLFPKSEK